jgi:hypothetical protein
MLVAYLPNDKVLFTADMLNRPSNGDPLLGKLLTMHLERWIMDKRLPVEKIVPVQGIVTSIDELRKANSDFQKGEESKRFFREHASSGRGFHSDCIRSRRI